MFWRTIFLIDALGALLTAFMLGVVLYHYQEKIGMPRPVLLSLAGVALLFAAYSFGCHFFLKKNWKPFLRTIIIANLLYTFASLAMLYWQLERLTLLGTVYFLTEIIVIFILIRIEVKVLTAANH